MGISQQKDMATPHHNGRRRYGQSSIRFLDLYCGCLYLGPANTRSKQTSGRFGGCILFYQNMESRLATLF